MSAMGRVDLAEVVTTLRSFALLFELQGDEDLANRAARAAGQVETAKAEWEQEAGGFRSLYRASEVGE